MRRIEVAGGIASGKTTLAKRFEESGYHCVFECFRENPFWRAFYEDIPRFAFETEVTFLLQHYHGFNAIRECSAAVVADYSVVLDRAYVDVTLDGTAKRAFLAVFDEVIRRLGPPDVLVHLRCDAEIELERILRRSRDEESAITLEYLDRLNESIRAHAMQLGAKQLVAIDSGCMNFADDEVLAKDIIDEVANRLSALAK